MLGALSPTGTVTTHDELYGVRNSTQHGESWTARVAIINNLRTARIMLERLKDEFPNLVKAGQDRLAGIDAKDYRIAVQTWPIYPAALEALIEYEDVIPSYHRPTAPPPSHG